MISQIKKRDEVDLDNKPIFHHIYVVTVGLNPRRYTVRKIEKLPGDISNVHLDPGTGAIEIRKVKNTDKSFKVDDPNSKSIDLNTAYKEMYGQTEKYLESTLKESIKSVLLEIMKEDNDEYIERQELNLMMQIQSAAHWLKKNPQHADSIKAVDLIVNRIDELVDAHKQTSLGEVAPPGWEGTVKAMKKHKEIDNPWALSWSMKNKGFKSHKK